MRNMYTYVRTCMHAHVYIRINTYADIRLNVCMYGRMTSFRMCAYMPSIQVNKVNTDFLIPGFTGVDVCAPFHFTHPSIKTHAYVDTCY